MEHSTPVSLSMVTTAITQVIHFNEKNKGSSMTLLHISIREPSIPLYIGLKIHAETRNCTS